MAGVDPVHLGIVAIFNLMIGLLTPPMGLALFLITDIAKVPMRSILKELLPLYIPLFGTLMIITFFRALVVVTEADPLTRSGGVMNLEALLPNPGQRLFEVALVGAGNSVEPSFPGTAGCRPARAGGL